MKKETIEFIERCFSLYESELEGTGKFDYKALNQARADLEAYKGRSEVERRIVDDIYKEFTSDKVIGLFDLGSRVCEIFVEHKYKK